MNNFIKQVIEEKFASKAQQRYFFAKANEKGASKKEKSKWGKMAKEFSDNTKYDEIPDKVEEKEVDEIVDKNGNVARGKKPTNFNTKGITQNKTTDEVVKSGAGQTSLSPRLGFGLRRYWAESDMSKSLGYDDTLGKDVDYDDAKNHFEDDLGLTDDEAEERLAKMGYDEKLPDDKVRLVENPKKFMEEYIESILAKKSKDSEIVSNEGDQMEEKEINPIVAKQLKSLKNSLKSHNLSVSDIMKHLKDDE
jgi:hypothetical protein